MRHPFQYLALAATPDAYILVAASGSSISTYRLNNGALLATWCPPKEPNEKKKKKAGEAEGKDPRPVSERANNDSQPPIKRTKRSDRGESRGRPAEGTAVDFPRSVTGSSTASKAAVTKLAITSDAKYVIAVTGDDKCIRVFDLLEDGRLLQRSERQLPKRPCAITVTPDNATILCADKFGDVYSLPLLGYTFVVDDSVDTASDTSNRKPSETTRRMVPAASALTVHTKKNQEALRNQLRMTNTTSEKRTCDFETRLLLGHVSLLTDLAYVNLDVQPGLAEGSRSYILTSDRDEHIRISRGIPQAHIIEGYCLGHTEFVSKLSVPYWRQDLLISGGGDSYLIIWDWLAGKPLHRVDLSSPYHHWHDSVEENRDKRAGAGRSVNDKIAVSGIWVMRSQPSSDHESEGEVFLAFEGIPAMFHWSLKTDGLMSYLRFYGLPGNVIDAVVLEHRASIIVSIDNVHEAGSTDIVRSQSSQEAVLRLHCLSFAADMQGEPTVRDVDLGSVLENISGEGSTTDESEDHETLQHRALSELLYSVEHLRKRSLED